jgi:fatty acid/phospholipid biosynthesis enzyme
MPRTAARRCSGCKGVSIICHGKSSPDAIKNAILVGCAPRRARMSDAHRPQLGHSRRSRV